MDDHFDKALESSRRNFLNGITALPLLSLDRKKLGRVVAANIFSASTGAERRKRFIAIQVSSRNVRAPEWIPRNPRPLRAPVGFSPFHFTRWPDHPIAR